MIEYVESGKKVMKKDSALHFWATAFAIFQKRLLLRNGYDTIEESGCENDEKNGWYYFIDYGRNIDFGGIALACGGRK